MRCGPLWIAIALVCAVPLACSCSNEPAHERDLNHFSAFSRWVAGPAIGDSVRALAVPTNPVSDLSGATSERKGWARSLEWDARIRFDLAPALADSVVPRVAAGLRRCAGSDSSRAEGLQFVRWQQGRDVLRVGYRTKWRVGELLVWSVAERDTLAGGATGVPRGAAVRGMAFDHSLELRLTEKPAVH